MSKDYRWIVRVKGSHLWATYAREVITPGPAPEEAIKRALNIIKEDGDNDLWLCREMTVTVERVR